MRHNQAVVVGVDFGTLSGRAVVVRVSDGAELGSAVHLYAHAVVERELPAPGELLPPDWALQIPSDWIDVLRTAVPQALAASGVDPVDVIGIGTDFTAGTVLPTTTDGTPLCELEHFRARRHAYRSSGSTTRPSRTPTGSTPWPRSAVRPGWPVTGAGSPASGSSPRPSSCWRRTPRSTPPRSAGWRRRTGSSGSCAAGTCATPAPPATRASTRTGATPRGSTWPR